MRIKYYNVAAATVYSELSNLRGDMMLLSDLLVKSNEELYEVYRYAIEHKDLKLINTIRSIISDRYCIKELKKSILDEPFKNPLIKRFFQC